MPCSLTDWVSDLSTFSEMVATIMAMRDAGTQQKPELQVEAKLDTV